MITLVNFIISNTYFQLIGNFSVTALKNWGNSSLEIIFQTGYAEFSDVDDVGSGGNGEFFVGDKEDREDERLLMIFETMGGLGGREIFDFPSDARKFGSADVSAFPARPDRIKKVLKPISRDKKISSLYLF